MTDPMKISEGNIYPVQTGKSDTGAALIEVQQLSSALNGNRHLPINLMEQICSITNMQRAFRQVKGNKGTAGVDGMTVYELEAYLSKHNEDIRHQLLQGLYKPQPVLEVMIPKPDGGERQLGIPTVVDRYIQQAIAQILNPIFDPTFSESSYGYRPTRSAHQALQAASAYVQDGRVWVVDLDLEKFFNRVNHDILMSLLAKRLADKRLLKLIRRYLEKGTMQDGLSTQRQAGTPQGSPLSPLLSNIMLDELDKELENRGHKFCRYVDDCNVYVRSERAGRRVMESITEFLSKRLRLTVNLTKSTVALVDERKFLGYRLQKDGGLTVAPESVQRFKDKIRVLTKRNRGRSLDLVIKEVNQTLRGWINYFRLSKWKSLWVELDSWIRRKLRCYRLKQRKKSRSIMTFLMQQGVGRREAGQLGSSGKGWWRLALTPALHRALNNAWFDKQGLLSLAKA